MARIKYYYNTETCRYEKAAPTAKSVFQSVVTYLAVGTILAVAGNFLMTQFIGDPLVNRLEEKNRQLMSNLSSFTSSITKLEKEIEDLQEKDRDVYRSILKADPLSDEEWRAGTGGAAEYDELEPDDLQKMRERIERVEAKVGVQRSSYETILKKFSKNTEVLQHTPAIRPVAGEVISGFGKRLHPILKIRKMHTGLDFQAPMNTPVYATADAYVKFTGYSSGGYGNQIDLDHKFGYSTKYAHLSKIVVKKGQTIKRGDLIGYTGSTGLSKGPHLHYEILKDGEKIDPIDFFYGDLAPQEYLHFRKVAGQYNESMD